MSPWATRTGSIRTATASREAAGTPENSARPASRLTRTSAGEPAGRRAAGAASSAPMTPATATAMPVARRTGPVPNCPEATGSRNEPVAKATVEMVPRTPRARPRMASGTTRWKIVVLVTSTTRAPTDATAMAAIATPSAGA